MQDIDEQVDALLQEKGKSSQPKKKKLGIGEPVLLYIETSPGIYELYNQQFDSKIEADQFAEREFPGARFKLYYLSEAQAEAEKLAKRREKYEKAKQTIKSGAKTAGSAAVRTGKAILDSALKEAEKEGLTKEQYEAKSRAIDLKKQQQELKQSSGSRPMRPQRPSFQPEQQSRFQFGQPQQPPQQNNQQQYNNETQQQASIPQQPQRQPQSRFNPNPPPIQPSVRFIPYSGQRRGYGKPQTPFKKTSLYIPKEPYRPHFVGRSPSQQVQRKKRKVK